MLLDTNALSAWAKNEPTFLRAIPMDRLWHVSVITLGEYRFGLLKSNQRESLEHWLDRTEPLIIVLTPDSETAKRYASLRYAAAKNSSHPPYHDLWIAALAEQHDLPLVSRDKDFDRIPGIRRVSW